MKPEINYDQFEKVDIRIGTVVSSEVPEWSHWVMRLKVDFGEEIGQRTIFSGIMKFYKPEDLIGKQFPFVVNLKPKRIGPANEEGVYEYSHGMMMMSEGDINVSSTDPSAAEAGEDIAPVLFNLQKEVPNGAVVR